MTERGWWTEDSDTWVNDTLTHVNEARRRPNEVDRCDAVCKALNKMWNAFFAYRTKHGQLTDVEREKGRSDFQAVTQLLVAGLAFPDARALCDGTAVRALADVRPLVMNHDTLMRAGYEPKSIADELRVRAQAEHTQLIKTLEQRAAAPEDAEVRRKTLKRLAQLLYVIRCNIAHSEKTPRGPDAAKVERDRGVSKAASAVIEDLVDLVLERPSTRLAVYGTLAPGQPNESVLAGVRDQRWCSALVHGAIDQRNGLRFFRWDLGQGALPVNLLTSDDLPNHLAVIDRFEGKQYVRSLIPAEAGSAQVIANIYEQNIAG